MKPTWKATLLLLATFTGGALAGGAAVAVADRGDMRRGHKPHRHDSRDHLEFMTRRLDLTPAQRDSVQAILGRYKPKMDSIWRQLGPRFETIKDSISNDIRRQLTPQQQTEYSKMIERFEQERREDGERRKPKE
jgi:Spy/CpxP family protein refolding chaperone